MFHPKWVDILFPVFPILKVSANTNGQEKNYFNVLRTSYVHLILENL